MPLSLVHRRRRLGHAPVPPRAPNNFMRATFANHPVSAHNIVPDVDDEDDSPSASSASSTDVATSATVSWLTVNQRSNLSDADMLGDSSISSSSSDVEAMASIDPFPTDVWSIAQRAATLGHRRYIALPATTSNNTVAARASHVHALVTQQILPLHLQQGRQPPRVLVVWANASRAARSRGIMRGLFTGALLAGTYPIHLDPSPAWLLVAKPDDEDDSKNNNNNNGNSNNVTLPVVLSCSPTALLRCEAEILPLNPVVVFAEMPVPEERQSEDDDAVLVTRDNGGGRLASRKSSDDAAAAAAAAELWHAVAGFAGSAGDERSRVYTFLDPAAAADRRAARLLRQMMRLEGVEVPALVARMAAEGIADPVDDDDGAADDGERDVGNGGVGDEGEGGVYLGHC